MNGPEPALPSPSWRRIVFFLVLTFALSSIFYWQIIAAGKMKMLPTLGLMWYPGVAALVTRLVFHPMTQDRGITPYITTEFGVGLAIAYTVGAWICWRKRGELAESAPAEFFQQSL